MDNLFWVASKIFTNIFSPSSSLFILLILGSVLIWTKFNLAGKWIISLAVGILFVIGIFPIYSLLLVPLEERFPAPKELPDSIDGIIVLAGPEQPLITAARGQPSLGANAERLTTFVGLAKVYPNAKLVFTGGMGSLAGQGADRTTTARMLFDQLGLDSKGVEYENKSRNTAEGVKNTFELIKPKNNSNWILITSAQHMPRSVGIFRKVGWQVIPYPVDYNTTGEFGIEYSGLDGAYWTGVGVHEWIGLFAYWITGKTAELFPAPSMK